MRIEIENQADRKFYWEVLNISAQYDKLLKNPRRKLSAPLMRIHMFLLIYAVLLVLIVVFCILFGAKLPQILCAVICVMFILRLVMALRRNRKLIERMMHQNGKIVLLLDEEGVTYSAENADTVRIPWSNTAFVRRFNRAFCFLGKSNMMIFTDQRYTEEILHYIRENDIPVEVIA